MSGLRRSMWARGRSPSPSGLPGSAGDPDSADPQVPHLFPGAAPDGGLAGRPRRHARGGFPATDVIERWLKAGVVEQGWFTPTDEGTPQGGVISPVLLNVALHGMEQAAESVTTRGRTATPGPAVPGSPVLIRYADDLLALCHSREQAEQVKARLAVWLEPRGLAFNEDKTRVVALDEGCDFLGFTIRRYDGKLLIKPSKAALVRLRKRLSAEMRALRGLNAEAVLTRLNPIIRGWSAYYRHVVSSREFNSLDDHMWKLTYKWAKHTHPHKPKRWIVSRYFGPFHPDRRDKWVFGDRETGAYLLKFSWTPIVRHVLVKGWASPDDPTLAGYWAKRRRRAAPPALGRHALSLLRAQHGRCPLCRGLLLHADHEPQNPQEWERWLAVIRKAVRKQSITAETGPDTDETLPTLRLIHTSCHRRIGGDNPAQKPMTPAGLARAGCLETGHGRFLGGRGAATHPGYPTGSRSSMRCARPTRWRWCWSTPGDVKNVPGRKTDVKDSEWLAQLLECGLLRGSFIPPRTSPRSGS